VEGIAVNLRLLSALLFSFLATPFSALAATYTYTGTEIFMTNSSSGQPLPLGASIQGSIVLTAPLAPSLPLTEVTPISYFFGALGLGSDMIGPSSFRLGTDADGNINDWVIGVSSAEEDGFVYFTFRSSPSGDTGNLSDIDFASQSGGSWASDVTPIPLPATGVLLLAALGATAGLARHRRRP
jgi:hypothetical protein